MAFVLTGNPDLNVTIADMRRDEEMVAEKIHREFILPRLEKRTRAAYDAFFDANESVIAEMHKAELEKLGHRVFVIDSKARPRQVPPAPPPLPATGLVQSSMFDREATK